ncbi:zf-HC2 domain-containing protein [Tellurirhabdus bombi]|uniref:zf-HC2 domain-containing protein n=1 Tax=Tellurirhabdus bombi TaxID=2907205 RepID=UPI001F200D42|nr:zf-HC2 domain-containing protein [Tellurirhabdus bombi]
MSGSLHPSDSVSAEGKQETAPMKERCDNQARCLKRIQAILDGGATEEEIEHFKQHIDICKPCIDMYHLEKCIRAALQGKVEKKCCPEKVAEAIKAQVAIS